ncbi:antifungal protein [Pyrenophora tritici-repentis]|uniref:Antifungal protein n=2 Tax=Pyrenophora tritici-repentis TaxID=45151 RepID=A0A2W1CSE7_9PLEO|nr:uncharacterized protein PTRG_03992 [Pyrenophora tritici-repentis Pt-1C-BFP]KAA8619937.1 Antifungal protein [Pyrenophora tritici-repentis]EDU46830.1 predicted protein [Pyrenophora tritici-repentis Pt-1C-BFP]KAF7448082.1 Antifungal protein [Pyrenophora tritici-repentis]KAF7571786.1 antifungal protein [Pyrenophora tritici-repentis]KAG9385005.1 Antifungal protein [Pyrenophora tritici-repentis]
MQFTTATLLFLTAITVVASPVESVPGDIRIKFDGKCTKSTDQCSFTRNGKTSISKCSTATAVNYRCTKDKNPCTYDDVDGKTRCT